MKNHATSIVLAGLLAAPLVSQGEAALELAKIIAVEEQEHDLDKAKKLYAAAIDDTNLSAAARQLASERLARLQQRLGNSPQGQGVEREKELRQQARALLKDWQNWRGIRGQALAGVPDKVAEQLLWIGEPAVAEAVIALQAISKDPTPHAIATARGLLQFLWQTGGETASRYLVDCASHSLMAGLAAQTSNAMKIVDINSPAVRAYLEHETADIAEQFLQARNQQSPLVYRLENEQVVTIAERGVPAVRAVILRTSGTREFHADQLRRMHKMVRASIKGTEPALGKAAELFLTSTSSQQSVEGLVILLENVPDLRRRGITIHPRLRSPTDPLDSASVAELARLTVAIDGCLRAIGKIESSETARDNALGSLYSLIWKLLNDERSDARTKLLEWWDLGWNVASAASSVDAINADNVMQYLQRVERVAPDQLGMFIYAFQGIEMPAEAFGLLTDLADQPSNKERREELAFLIASTGKEEAADWIIAQWRQYHMDNPRVSRSRKSPYARALLQLGRRNKSETVRSAMKNMARGFGGKRPRNEVVTQLLLALLSMGDERALDFVSAGLSGARSDHPYAPKDQPWNGSPLQYLIYTDADPKHPFTEEQVVATVTALLERVGNKGHHRPKHYWQSKMSDRVLLLFATMDAKPYEGSSWLNCAMSRLDERLTENGDVSLLEPWFLSIVGKGDVNERVAGMLHESILKRYRKQLMPTLDGPSEYWADNVASDYWSLDRSVSVEKMLANRHVDVRRYGVAVVRDGEAKVDVQKLIPLLADGDVEVRRMLADFLGAKVSKEAVPGLIELLRDPHKHVREAASKALTRIRFYHEQQAHWDRVLKGVDASPASAAEKLLIQARPGAKKEQRLLAIKSLGVLGVPEALPFLIEWSQGDDPDVAKTARDAITEIHLKPRK